MDRKLFGMFSGRQITMMVISAIVTPSALYGAVATQAVTITDPNTGAKSSVDAARRLSVYDAVGNYANYPGNYVRISGSCENNAFNTLYIPPAGKVLVAKAVNISFHSGVASGDNSVYIMRGGNGVPFYVAGIESENAVGSQSIGFGNGFYLRHDESFQLTCKSGTYFVSMQGYLVPVNSAPTVE